MLEAKQVFSRSLEEVFPFFSDALNLEQITPPWLRFRILTKPPIAMHEGTRIDYRLRIHGIPVSWRSEIATWEPPYRFVDQQIRGPYRLWHHEHRFEADGDETHMTDIVRYSVPGGSLVDRCFVAHRLRQIFQYRQSVLADLFEAVPTHSEVTLKP